MIFLPRDKVEFFIKRAIIIALGVLTGGSGGAVAVLPGIGKQMMCIKNAPFTHNLYPNPWPHR